MASVALVQAVQDAHKAFSNFFNSLTGKRRGRKVGKPRYKSRKDTRQSFRLTRNGFSIKPNGRLYLAKIGDVWVRWSRDLPSTPSSVTVIREPDGHYYASFVVEVQPEPFAVIEQECGMDLGIARMATIADTAKQRADLPNPRHLARKMRKLRRVAREKARRAKGSANRAKARRREAQQHSKVARTRRDYHHKQAFQSVRDNQAIHLEDLNIAGMVRNLRLARSISHTGWGQFVRLIEEKAERHGRTVNKVSRWLPSSKTCSGCGWGAGDLPLSKRTFECSDCGLALDRDHNAAINILAAGRAERLNACGDSVRRPASRAHESTKQEAPVMHR